MKWNVSGADAIWHKTQRNRGNLCREILCAPEIGARWMVVGGWESARLRSLHGAVASRDVSLGLSFAPVCDARLGVPL